MLSQAAFVIRNSRILTRCETSGLERERICGQPSADESIEQDPCFTLTFLDEPQSLREMLVLYLTVTQDLLTMG